MYRLVTGMAAVILTIILIVGSVSAFTSSEKQVISNLRARITALEEQATSAQSERDALASRLDALEANQVSMAADIDTLDANDQTLDRSIGTLDEGLKGIVSDDGPLASLNAMLNDLTVRVNGYHPPIAITDITPVVTCDGTSCTVSVEWKSDPPATGQVEWGETIEYGNLTTLERNLLDFHRQRIGTFPQDGRTYHFRIIATTPDGETGVISSSFQGEPA